MENIAPERTLSSLLTRNQVDSPTRITLENNGKFWPQAVREKLSLRESGGADGTASEPSLGRKLLILFPRMQLRIPSHANATVIEPAAVSAVCRPCARASLCQSAARSRSKGHSTASAPPCVPATLARRGPNRRPRPPAPQSAWRFGAPRFGRLVSPCKPCAL